MNKRRKEQKKTLAAKSQLQRSKITSSDQLDILDKRLGKDVGAVRERARLRRLINKRHKRQK